MFFLNFVWLNVCILCFPTIYMWPQYQAVSQLQGHSSWDWNTSTHLIMWSQDIGTTLVIVDLCPDSLPCCRQPKMWLHTRKELIWRKCIERCQMSIIILATIDILAQQSVVSYFVVIATIFWLSEIIAVTNTLYIWFKLLSTILYRICMEHTTAIYIFLHIKPVLKLVLYGYRYE